MAFLQARQLTGPTPSLTNSHQRAALSRGCFYEACYYTQQNENESPHPLAGKHPVDTVQGFFVVTEAGGSLATRLNGELQPTGVRKAAKHQQQPPRKHHNTLQKTQIVCEIQSESNHPKPTTAAVPSSS